MALVLAVFLVVLSLAALSVGIINSNLILILVSMAGIFAGVKLVIMMFKYDE